MILAIDIGNTNIVVGGITQNNIDFMARLATDKLKTKDEYGVNLLNLLQLYHIDRKSIEGCIISSVVPPVSGRIKRAVELATGQKPIVVGPGIKTGLNILMDNPAAVGSDRIVSSVAALSLFKPPILIIDMGTATTIDTIDKKGNYIGGCIMPGVNISLQALTAGTAQLPGISLEDPKTAIGKNTVDCMRSGIIYGTASMIEGYVARIEKELGERATVVVTGGLGRQICRYCIRDDFNFCDDLLLRGLSIIYKKNMQ